jgi:micrococcal nuclease
MSVARRASVLALLLFVLGVVPVHAHAPGPFAGTVVCVVDGDTFNVLLAEGRRERVRVLGLDTPETVDPRRPAQCYGAEATRRATELVLNQPVLLTREASQGERDPYGRLLANVLAITYPDGITPTLLNVARDLFSSGYGVEYIYRVPHENQALYRAAQAEAMADGRGLWAADTCAGTTSKADLDDDAEPPSSELPPATTGSGAAPAQPTATQTPVPLTVAFAPTRAPEPTAVPPTPVQAHRHSAYSGSA